MCISDVQNYQGRDVEEDRDCYEIVLEFFQSWGQSLNRRVNALRKAIQMAGFRNVTVKVTDRDRGWEVGSSDAAEEAVFTQFYQDFKECWPKGFLDAEIRAVRRVIEKYHDLNRGKMDREVAQMSSEAREPKRFQLKYDQVEEWAQKHDWLLVKEEGRFNDLNVYRCYLTPQGNMVEFRCSDVRISHVSHVQVYH